MNKKILKVGNRNKLYSYKEIYSYKNREILAPVNKSIEKGNNVVYCMCNGKNEKKSIKMHTRKSENNTYYSLATNSKSSLKHNPSCPKYNEAKSKKELILKGRVYNNLGMSIDLSIEKNKGTVDKNEKYTPVYGVGEMVLVAANNAYIDIKGKIGKENDVLSYLYRYYAKGETQSIDTYLNDLVVSPTLGLKLGQVIFNPKWIKCDTVEDKTSAIVRSYIQLNKRYSNNAGPILQYVLMKYVGYTVTDNDQVKIELYTRGKNTKENFNKKVFIHMNKFDFFKRFNMDKVEDEYNKAEYFVSALIYAEKGVLFAHDIAFIPVYAGYCIPVDTTNEIKLLSELLAFRDKLTIKKVAKMTELLEFGNIVPDLIVSVKGMKEPILIEFFDWILPEYYEVTLSKTLKYEQLSNEGKCKFLGFYNNLGWSSPPIDVILYPKFKTMQKLGLKVDASIAKILKTAKD